MSYFLYQNRFCKISDYQPNNLDKGKIWVDFYQSNNFEKIYESGVVDKTLLQPYLVADSKNIENNDLQSNCKPFATDLQSNCNDFAKDLQPKYNGFTNAFGGTIKYNPIPPNNSKTIEQIANENKELIEKLLQDSFIKSNSIYQGLDFVPVTPSKEFANNIGLTPETLRPILFAAKIEKTKQTYEKKYIKKQYHIFYCFVCVLISFGLALIIFGFDLINFDNEEIFINEPNEQNLIEDKNFVLSLERKIKVVNQKPYTYFDFFVDSLATCQNKKIYDYSKDLIKKDFEKSNKNKSNLIAITNERLKAIK